MEIHENVMKGMKVVWERKNPKVWVPVLCMHLRSIW